MTKIEFQVNRSGELKKIFESQFGAELINVLGNRCPAYDASEHEHLFINNRGKIEGYNLCIRELLSLSIAPQPTSQPEANYGIPDKA